MNEILLFHVCEVYIVHVIMWVTLLFLEWWVPI